MPKSLDKTNDKKVFIYLKMIVNMVRGNIFETPHSRIAFAVNTEGSNDAGFAGQVSSRYWG